MDPSTPPAVQTPVPAASPAVTPAPVVAQPAAVPAPAVPAAAPVVPQPAAAPAQVVPPQADLPGVGGRAAPAPAAPERKSYTADEISRRVEREVGHRVKKVLGMDLETAVSRLRAADELQRLANDGTERSQQQQAIIDQLRTENTELRAQLSQTEEKVSRVKRKYEDDRLTLIVKTAAARAGVAREHEDFAIFQYRAQVKRDLAAKKQPPKATEFFNGLRQTHAMIFTDGQTPVVVAPSTAGPESVPGTTPPPPASTTETPAGPEIDRMDDSQFRQHTKSKYGFSFGA